MNRGTPLQKNAERRFRALSPAVKAVLRKQLEKLESGDVDEPAVYAADIATRCGINVHDLRVLFSEAGAQ